MFFLLPIWGKLYKTNFLFSPDGIIPTWGFKYKIATIHDLAFLKFRDTVTKKGYYFLEKNYRNTIYSANKIITVSNFSTKDILEKYFFIQGCKSF